MSFWHLTGFRLDITADFRLPGFDPVSAPHPDSDLLLRRVSAASLSDEGDRPRFLRHLTVSEGRAYAMLESEAGDILFQYGRRALFHLSADCRLLRCATEDQDLASQRVLLDTILWTVSLLQGHELLHASAVATPAGVVAFSAASGGGKTSLAVESIRRGAAFFTDDVLALDQVGGEILASPGPPLTKVPSSFDPTALGEVTILDAVGDEQWVQVKQPRSGPLALAAIVLVDRSDSMPLTCTRLSATNLDLMPHVFGFFHLEGRVQNVFNLLAEVATGTPVLRLTADSPLSASRLIDELEEHVSFR